MKTITFVSIVSVIIAGATLSVIQSPEKIPQAVWREVPSIPGAGLSGEEWQQISRTYGSLTISEREANARHFAVQRTTQPGRQANSIPTTSPER